MRSRAFNNLKPSRLRKLMLLSFFALAIPTAILVYKSYDQLKWEAFYQHRVLAEELSKTIDKKFRDLIKIEQGRVFSDYTFATEDENNTLLVKRSPLSTLPIENAAQGVIGYFQIDANGEFSTPFLPATSDNQKRYVLTPNDKSQRQTIQDQIKRILTTNRLVESQNFEPSEVDLDEVTSLGADSESLVSKAPSKLNQTAFDRLSKVNESVIKESTIEDKKDNVLNRLEELESTSPYKEKVNLRERETLAKKKSIHDSSKSAYAKNQPKDIIEEVSLAQSQALSPNNINLFKNDTDPFEISLLDSGHFVLYRKVWRNEKRFIQGILLQQERVLNDLIEDSFNNSLLFTMSNLTVVYQGNALTSFSQQNQRSYFSNSYRTPRSALEGTLLLRTRLSAPFNELESVFTVRRLPAGAGGKVILWSALIMILTLVIVIYSLYRMSLRNLSLVNQQQDFVSAVSHELKTPLTSIRMYGEILQQGWADEEKKKSYYSFIFDESERLTRLINNVLELARMTRNETSVTLQNITVHELIDVIQSKIDSQIGRAQFKLNITIDDGTATKQLNIDQDVFAQIVINLVDNALKFSSDAKRKEIDLKVQHHSNGKLCFSIRDYGPGIAKDQLKKIFTLFYRSENELTRNTTGTGIGLALVNQLTQLMNGKVDVINRDPGAEFHLLFNTSKGE